jgi:uncharacterized protein (TIGR01777 family)
LVRTRPQTEDEFVWDIERAEIDAAALEGVDAVIHLGGGNIAAGRWTVARKEVLWKSRINSTALLVNALQRCAVPPKIFVCASAIGIYGNRGDEVLSEESELGHGFLADLGREWESAAAAAPMQVVHARFGVVLSRAGGALAKMHLPFNLGLGGRLGSGRQFMSWISLEDAVAAIYWMVSARALSGPVNVVAPEPVRNSEFTRALGRALGRPTLFPAPVFALRMALGEMADEALLSSQRVEPAKLLAADFTFSLPNVDSALSAELG